MGSLIDEEIKARIKQLERHVAEGYPPFDRFTVPEKAEETEMVEATIRLDGIILEAVKSHRLRRI